MAIQLPSNFKKDIQAKDTTLVPVVVIGTYIETYVNDVLTFQSSVEDFIWISTNVINIHVAFGWDVTTSPILLNIPSLKESIDIEKRNYKISAINIDISNFLFDNKRFSEQVAGSLINTECRIFWISPSNSEGFTNLINFEGNGLTDNLQVYNGKIKKYDMTDEKIRLVVEDKSQDFLQTKLPQHDVGTEGGVPDKYKNKPKPIVYGHVDRSPCVIGAGNTLWFDHRNIASLVMDEEIPVFGGVYQPLFINIDDIYINVLSFNERDLGSVEKEAEFAGTSLGEYGHYQWKASEADPSWGYPPTIKIVPNILTDNNMLQCKAYYKPSSVLLGRYDLGVDGYSENTLTEEQQKKLVDNNYNEGIGYLAEIKYQVMGDYLDNDAEGIQYGVEGVVFGHGMPYARLVISPNPPISGITKVKDSDAIRTEGFQIENIASFIRFISYQFLKHIFIKIKSFRFKRILRYFQFFDIL